VNKKIKKIKRATLSSTGTDVIIESNCHIFIINGYDGLLKKHI